MSVRLFAVVGPSGAGKDMLMQMAAQAVPGLRLARRVITRPSAAGSEDFEGVTEAEFEHRRAAGDFALHWPAHGLRYGIPASELVTPGTVLFNASRAVLAEAAARWPGLAVVLVTAPPALLASRLAGRGREAAGDQELRLARASVDLPPGLDLREVVNDCAPGHALRRFLLALQPESA